jgi:hypothetical protein
VADALNPPLPGLVEVHLTGGPDAVVLHCEPEVAARLFDAREVERYVGGTVPARYEYDSRLVMILHRIKQAWPSVNRATYGNLVDILNAAGFHSPYGRPWTRHNLRQKVEAIGFDVTQIVNPAGQRGDVVLWRVDAPDAVADAAAAMVHVREAPAPPPDDGADEPSRLGPASEWDARRASDELADMLAGSGGG